MNQQQLDQTVELCMQAIDNADVKHYVRTTFDKGLCDVIKQACKQSVKQALEEKTND